MISPNLPDNGPRMPPNYFLNKPNSSPPSPSDVEKTDRVAAMNKITNFSIAAIMNSQRNRKDEDEDEFEAKRRKLAEAVPALGKHF